MDRDIVYDESEMSIVANNAMNYADFLSRCIDEYVGILSEMLKNKGIKDDNVSPRMEQLVATMAPYRIAIYECQKRIKSSVNGSINDIANADNFMFPTDAVTTIINLLAKFL